MKVLKKELKKDKGEILLSPDSLDDLWHIYHLLEKGDLVEAWTHRKVIPETDKIRPDKPRREAVKLSLVVEEIDFHTFSSRLRIRGKIKEGIDIGSYHTFSIQPFDKLSIKKSWKREQIERIEDAVRESRLPPILILTIEEGECIAGEVRQWGVQETFRITASYGKRENYPGRRKFFQDVFESLKNSQFENLVIAGPGFAKEDFYNFIKGKMDKDRIVLDSCSSIGTSGFQEVLRRGCIDRIVRDLRIAKEAKLIERLMEEIAKNGKVAYGIEEVEKAAGYGAIELLLITDDKAGLLEEFGKVKHIIFSTEWEPGRRLKALGGIAAFLRFSLQK
jgi:protein pelota